jgi:hypothetical protein
MAQGGLVALAPIVAVACGCVSTEVAGQVQVQSAALGAIALSPNECLSGARGYFLGVDLVDEAQQAGLRVIAEPLGGTALKLTRVFATEQRSVLFHSAMCRTIRLDLRRTGWRVNNIQDVSGELQVDCTTDTGDRMQGRVVFEHCH